MARSSLLTPSIDAITDDGAVLWSIVQGEQLEQVVTLDFLTNAFGYTYEAVVAEANNVANGTEPPVELKPSGIKTSLNVRVPTDRGVWVDTNSYTREDIAFYDNKWYRKTTGINIVNATPPNVSPLWVETKPNVVYIQIPKELGSDWSLQPAPSYSVYGYFELRVTEPPGAVFVKTWKPLRGIIEIEFSPTELI